MVVHQEHLHEVFNASPLAMIEWDATTGTILSWNPSAARIFGWSADEAVGANLLNLLVPADSRDALAAVRDKLLAGKMPEMRNRNTRRNGTVILCRWHNIPLRSDDGRVIRFLSQVEDISATENQAAALLASERRLQALLGEAPIILFVCEPDGTITYAGGRALDRLGFTEQTPVGMNLFDLYPDRTDGIARLRGVVEHGQSVRWQTLLGGGAFDIWAGPYQRDGVRGLIGVATDITERRQAEAEQRQLQEQVIAAQAAAIRELSTPLLPIADGVVVLPLVGAIDSQRAQQVIEVLLGGIGEHSARVAILDITGVQVVDTATANVLLQSARAAQLLGTKVMMTGIRPEVAQTLVALGVDLDTIQTFATLRQAVQHALAAPRGQRAAA